MPQAIPAVCVRRTSISVQVLPFGLSLSPHVFTKVAEAALVPLREQGVRILNYLDDWLSLRISYANTGIWCSRTSASWAFGSTGKRANSCRCRGSLFLVWSLDSVNQTACLTQEHAQLVLNCLNMFKNMTAAPLKQFQRLLGHMAAAAAVTPLGLLHMRPLQHWLHGRVPRWAWQSGTLQVQVTPACRQTFTPWSDLSFFPAGVPLEQVSRHAVVYTDASAKGWGATFNGLAVLGVWTGPQLHWHIKQLPRVAGSTPTDSEMGHLMAPASRPLETSCLVPGRDAEVLGDLPQEVVDTINSARAPSTRHAYALKGNLFVEWCSSHREDPRRCPIRVVLSFLQQGLERRLSPSTLKVYVAAIAANHDPVEGKSVGNHDWVVRFLRGARRLDPPRPPSIPSWDLSLVLRALQQGPVRAFADSRAQVSLNENSAPACTGLH